MIDYWELYKKVKAFYLSLGRLPCSALGGQQIIFDKVGLRHMMNKNHHKRSVLDQIRRFKLFLNIREILPKTQLAESNREGYYRLVGTYKKRKVRIIVAPLNNGGIRFISIH